MTRKEPYEIPFNEYQFMRIVEEDERCGGLNCITPTFKKSIEQTYKRSITAALAAKKRINKDIMEEWRAWVAGAPVSTNKQTEIRVKIENPYLPRRYSKIERFLAERIAIAHMKPTEAKRITALLNSAAGAELIIQNSDDKIRLFHAAICLAHNNDPWALKEYQVSPTIRRAAGIAAVAAFIGESSLLRRIRPQKPPGNRPRSEFKKGPRVFIPPVFTNS